MFAVFAGPIMIISSLLKLFDSFSIQLAKDHQSIHSLVPTSMSATLPDSGLSRAARYAVPFVLLLIPLWTIRVNAVIPKPYLDEVFHVPQAQAYWAHKWTQWDPKITTPPGLYLWSYILCACVLALRGDPTELTTEVLRFTNVGAASVFIPWRLQTLLDSLRKERNNRPASAWLSHTVLNICLFPPLFFFSGLYYTDILALLVVVEAYNWQIRRNTGKRLASLGLLVLGLVALAFRQTNIFWAAAFLGGLQVVRTVRQASNPCESTDIVDIVKKGLQNELYDPFVSSASVAGKLGVSVGRVILTRVVDYFKASVSLAAASLSNFSSVLTSVIPHLLILAGFGAFVAWNNGVVLGKTSCQSYVRNWTNSTQDTRSSTLLASISLRCSTSGPISCSFRGLFSLAPSLIYLFLVLTSLSSWTTASRNNKKVFRGFSLCLLFSRSCWQLFISTRLSTPSPLPITVITSSMPSAFLGPTRQ